MADAARDIPRMSATEYLQMEKQATSRHEFVNGVVYAMAGGSRRHNMIVNSIFAALSAGLRAPCEIFTVDVKVNVEATNEQDFFYPDVVATCSELDNDEYLIKYPSLVVEVLSRSTEGADRGYKFDAYKKLPSLQEYVLVHQERARVEIFRRRTDWQQEVYEPEAAILLDSIGATVPIAQFYRRIKF
jgi:Uma2 family endonuclease